MGVFFSRLLMILLMGIILRVPTAYSKRRTDSSLDTLFEHYNEGHKALGKRDQSRKLCQEDSINEHIKFLVNSLDVPIQQEKKQDQKNSFKNKRFTVAQEELMNNAVHKNISVYNTVSSNDAVKNNASYDNETITHALAHFTQNKDFGQVALQQVIDLLDIELNVVRHLIVGHTGAAIEQAIEKRNVLLQRTAPISITMYDTVISHATCDNQHATKLYRNTKNGKKLPKALTAYDQKMFLSMLENTIEHYRMMLRRLQG